MTRPVIVRIVEANADALTKNGHAAERAPMTMNMIETIDEVAALPGQLDDHGKTAGAASMRIKVQLIDPHRSDAMVAWTTNAPFWQGAVMTAIRKLGMEAALTGAARAEVERCLERNTRRQNTGSGSIRIFGA